MDHVGDGGELATVQQWVNGARPRTLPAAVAPVVLGSAIAAFEGGFLWFRALLALLVALLLQVGVNYANDYSDGVKGTDEERVGPVRLVGQRLASPGSVKAAALLSLALAACLGLILVALSGAWWLLAVGAAAIAAAWLYTGGPRPYGYAGLGEVFVFVFFGLVAVVGTTYTQTGSITWISTVAGVVAGAWACAILMVNNIRDAPGDVHVGKNTLAVRLGDTASRWLFVTTIWSPFLLVIVLSLATPWALLGLVAMPVAIGPTRLVLGGAEGPALIPGIAATSMLLLAGSVATGIGFVLAATVG